MHYDWTDGLKNKTKNGFQKTPAGWANVSFLILNFFDFEPQPIIRMPKTPKSHAACRTTKFKWFFVLFFVLQAVCQNTIFYLSIFISIFSSKKN